MPLTPEVLHATWYLVLETHDFFFLFSSFTYPALPCCHSLLPRHFSQQPRLLPVSATAAAISSTKQKLAALREEVNAADARALEAETKAKLLQDEQIQKDHEITSLKNKLTLVEADLEKAENRIAEAKLNLDEGETSKTVGETLARKVSLLESELDNAERNLRETTEK